MKKMFVILISIVAAALLVAVGWWFGFQQRLLTEAYAVPTVDKEINDAAVTFSMFHQLDSGRVADAKHMLKVRLDGDIAAIDALMNYTDARTREMAQKIFTTVGEYRAIHPYSYTGTLARADVETDARIASILQKAKQERNDITQANKAP
jgi:hypothetical protein